MSEVRVKVDLAGWLLAQIAEDERVARKADTGERWESHRHYDALNVLDFKPSVPWEFDSDGVPEERLLGDRFDEPANTMACLDQADHIAAWDPARVLAECEAKRRIIAIHHDVPPGRCAVCNWVGGGYGSAAPQAFPCPTLRWLAQPYRDRAGYDESWRP